MKTWRHARACMFVVSLLACGCGSSQNSTAVTPQEISRSTACALDGMLLADYPGPKAQMFYVGADQPEFYCDLMEMFHLYLKPEQVRAIRAIYVQDMGKADWERPAGHWIDAHAAFFVLDSTRQGPMGKTLASFATEADAKVFVSRYAGRIVAFDKVTADSVALDGGALHDGPM